MRSDAHGVSHCLFPSAYTSIASFFFYTNTPTTEIYTLSLHDALPISSPRTARARARPQDRRHQLAGERRRARRRSTPDRKSTRLNSSHTVISYAVFCLKKKKKKTSPQQLLVLLSEPYVLTRWNNACML